MQLMMMTMMKMLMQRMSKWIGFVLFLGECVKQNENRLNEFQIIQLIFLLANDKVLFLLHHIHCVFCPHSLLFL